MFEAIRNNKRIAQVILAILIVPFAAFGLDNYFGDRMGRGEIATVGGTSISRAEFENALEEQRRLLREQLGEGASTDTLGSEKLRQEVLDRLIIQRALALYYRDMRLSVTGGQLQQAIAGIEAFRENGQFSQKRYQALLSRRGMTPAGFEAQFTQDLLSQQLMDSIFGSSLVARGSAHRLLVAGLEERVVREMRFPVAPHLADIKIDDAAIQKFYDDNPARFEFPERIKAEYLVLSEEALQNEAEANKTEISEEAIQKAYQDWPDVRQVRHILIELAPEADEAATETARKEAEEIAASLRKEPDRFPALAREKSQDPGSSGAGGELGNIARDGTMDPSFEEAVFMLKQDEISNPVRTRYGFHILQVTDIQKRSLAETRDEIIAWIRKQALAKGFDEKATKFSEMVFNEAPDSLQPAAEAFGLEIRRTDWVSRGTDDLGGVRNERLVASLFDDDALNQRRNTQAIEVGFNTLVSARVLEHEAARRVPLEDVRGQIEAQLRREEAMRMAREEGNAVLAALDQNGEVNNAWSAPSSFQRSKPDLPPQAARAVFAAPLTRLPARVAVELPDDAYVIYQIDEVERPTIDNDDPRVAEMAAQYGLVLGQNDFGSFLASLRDRYKVVVKPVAGQPTE
ncbi:MAG: SurA N-terminal domain-containing protein [Betaproteobacteria bacterium]|nr:SurA N-terminal domain-containing protein [Betaproteobacteria bacterium]